jgi:hypothetical protein
MKMNEHDEKFWSLFAGVILGAEGDGDGSDGSDDDGDDDEGGEGEGSDDDGGEGDGDENKPKVPTQADIDALQAALEKERRLTKRLTRRQGIEQKN